MTELGESSDPRALVPGDADAVRALARSFTAYAGDLREAGGGLRAIDATSAWRGRAADAFREAFATRPQRWSEAGDAFTEAARALAIHAETLTWAQGQAAEAARLWAVGEPSWSAARDVLDRARDQLRSSGDDAAARVAGATDPAPLTPWGHVEALGDAALDVGAGMVDAAASLGNAALHDPGSIAAVVGGAGLIAAGAGGAAGGALATASGVGAPVGVPATAASIGLVVSGAALAGAGAFTVAQSAAGPERVSPAGSDAATAPPAPRPPAERPPSRTPLFATSSTLSTAACARRRERGTGPPRTRFVGSGRPARTSEASSTHGRRTSRCARSGTGCADTPMRHRRTAGSRNRSTTIFSTP